MEINFKMKFKRFVMNEKKGIQRINDFFSDWVKVFGLLMSRFIKPISAPNFVLYFFTIILGLGAVGPWILGVKGAYNAEFYKSLSTCALALAAGSYGEIILNQNRDSDDSKNKVPCELRFPYACLFLATSACAVLGLVLSETEFCGIGEKGAVLSSVLGLALWWQVNAGNPNYMKEKLDPEDAIASRKEINTDNISGFNL